MKANGLVTAVIAIAAALAPAALCIRAQENGLGSGQGQIKHVLLLSIDGMHAVDFYNCSHGIVGANNGDPYCPNMAGLSRTAVNYVAASSSKPSDSFPGTAALMSGGLNPSALQAVQAEGTAVLSQVAAQLGNQFGNQNGN